MTESTPNLGLILYNSTSDQAQTFLSFRSNIAGVSTGSNFYKIDTAYGNLDERIDTLELTKGAVYVSAEYVSPNYYEATSTFIDTYITGMLIVLKLDTTSDGTVTLKINELSTISVMKVNAEGSFVNISGSELKEDMHYLFMYDGTRWIWVSAASANQVFHSGTAGNLVKIADDTSISDSVSPSSLLSSTISDASEKTSPVPDDTLGIGDSEDSNALKKIEIGNTYKAFYRESTEKTVSGGVLTVDQNSHSVQPESGTSDEIDTISGMSDNTEVILFAADAGTDTLVFKHNAGNISCFGGVDIELSEGFVIGFYDGTTVYLAGGGGGGGGVDVTPYRIVVSVVSNDITLALKDKDGNDPSPSSPVRVQIGDTVREVTSTLSVTVNAGTNWCNSGSAELATKEVDYFVYLGYNDTDGVVIGFSRIPFARIYSDFSATTTSEKYAAISTITNADSGDAYAVIGRFAATLSAGAGYAWSVPTYNASNLIHQPIHETRVLEWTPSASANVSMTYTTVTISVAEYRVVGRDFKYQVQSIGTIGGTPNNTVYLTTPFAGRNDNFQPALPAWVLADTTAEVSFAYVDQVAANRIAFRRTGSASWTAGANKYANSMGSYPIK